MRPVNLIPSEERRGGMRPMRSGPLAYIIVGALLAALGAVTLMVVTDNQISNSRAEATELREQTASAEAEATRLAPYIQFHALSSQRILTVSNLANSRFDWQKVMRQLALVLPDDVWITNLTGTVRPDVSVSSGENIALRTSVPGPALSLVGCAPGQEAVARFVTVLKDIDGVTRVGVQSSELPAGGSSGGDSGSASASGNCQIRKFIAQFQIVVAFDAAPIPASPTGEEVTAEPAPAPEGEAATTSTEGE